MTAITWPRAAVATIGGTARFVPTAARVIATTLALSALAFAAGPARAADPIMGEFGVALGEPFDKDQVIGRRALTDSSVSAWQFRPEIPLDIFREYYVVVAPDDNVVLGILARSDRYASMAECRAIMPSSRTRNSSTSTKGAARCSCAACRRTTTGWICSSSIANCTNGRNPTCNTCRRRSVRRPG